MTFVLRRALLASAAMGGGWGTITSPVGFDWTDYPVTIQQFGSSGQFRVVEDVSTFAPAGVTYYVDPVSGNNLAAGTADAPLKTLKAAAAKADVVVIYAKPGIYGRTGGFDGVQITKTLALRRWGDSGRLIIHGGQDDLAWELDGVLTHTYKATRSAVNRVLDLSITDGDGYATRLTLQANAADVEANPGSWYLDGTNVVWIRTADDREPDEYIVVQVVNCMWAKGDITIYTEYCDFYVPPNVFLEDSGAGQTPAYYAKDCRYYHAFSNGLTLEGVSVAVVQDCVASKNDADGFNYHAQDSVVPQVVEVGCTGNDNGTETGVGNDNGSTIHDGGDIIRVNGSYARNIGPNVVESGAGTEAWCLGCSMLDSASDVVGLDIGALVAQASWFDHCTLTGNEFDISAGAGTAYIRACTYVTTGSAGTITAY